MSKYKVGDRVVVISEEEADKKQDVDPGFVNDMKQYCGKTVTIKDVKKLGCGSTNYYIEEAEWAWCDEFFEGLEKDTVEKAKDLVFNPITFNPKALDAYGALEKASQYGKDHLRELEDAIVALTEQEVFYYQPYKFINTLKGANNTMNKKDILVVRNYNDRAMVVQFNKKDKNGKNIQTRAEVHDGDTFDLDNGIRICLLKYLLGGHKEYMTIMDAARKAYKKTVKEDQKKALAPVREAAKKMEEKEKRDKEMEELIAKAIKKALAETGEEENKTVEE